MLKRYISISLYLFLFLLPFQTRWIYSAAFLNGQYFEYGTFCLYATEILLGVIMLLGIAYGVIRINLHANDTNTRMMRIRKIMPFIIALLILTLNCVLAINSTLAFYKLSWLIMAVALAFLIISFQLDWKKISWTIIASATVQSIFAIQQFFSQQVVANKWLGMASQLPATLGVPVVEANGIRWLRTFGTLSHPNMLAGFLAIGLTLMVLLAICPPAEAEGKLSEKSKRMRRARQLFIYTAFCINFFALLTALSRGALLAFGIALAVLIVVSFKKKLQTVSALSFACLALIIFAIFSFAYPQLISSRALGTERVENTSNTTRVEQYHEFWQIYKTNWVMGVGLGNYPLALHQLKPNEPAYSLQPIHNTFLLILAELGLFGALLVASFILLVIVLIYRLLTSKRVNANYAPRECREYANATNATHLTCFTCLACLICLAFFDHYFWSFYFGVMLTAIILSLTFLSNQRAE